MKKIVVLSLIFATLGLNANPVKWSYSVNPLEGSKAELVFSASIDPSYQLYGTEFPSGGPRPTEFIFDDSKTFKKIGKVKENPAPKIKFDQDFGINVAVHSGNVRFIQTIEILSEKDFTISGTIDYMVCDENSCFPQDADFKFSVKGRPQTPFNTDVLDKQIASKVSSDDEITDVIPDLADMEEKIAVAATTTDNSESSSENIWWFILLALGAGFACILTPCVFPMIPLTISFFMSGGAKRSESILKGVIFGFSIAVIYGLLGVIVAITKSPELANVLSTHWIANLIFFALFVAFACSFFGLFEIKLPTGLSNKLDAKADKGGLIAAFFMAAVLTLVSFSCTGPFAAALLVEAAMGTSVLKPILGMFAFGFAFGLPFMILSMSPALMKKMPKSGGWLNSVKVVFAFILLAFAMTFLLTIDTVYNLHLFTREVYIGIWIVIFSLMGFYLLGKIKFSYDSDVKHLGVFRLFLVIATFSFVMYLIPGLFGASLKMISSLKPPMSAQQFNLQKPIVYASVTSEETGISKLCGTPKWSDKFQLPHGLQGYFDFEEGMACARQLGKPVFLDFTGHGCKNCKEMEANVWGDPEVLELLNQYLIIVLNTNDRTALPESEWVTSKLDGKVKKTIGKVNYSLQMERFNTNALPYYVILDSEGNPLTEKGIGAVSKKEFIAFLKKGLGR
ncbi:MAG: thioredoxin family protein [Bacteroidales bacterium]|jgi:thiol:disulfide interchange protein DsbD|nr:thioredoxin family protein [Bacteroidales bacterium]